MARKLRNSARSPEQISSEPQIDSDELQELDALRNELKSEQNRLRKLAANTFSILTETRITEHGVVIKFLGDVPPEEKIGLRSGTAPRNIEELISMMHPDDVPTYRQNMSHSIATGERFRTVYRLADGFGGWRWLEVQGVSVGVLNDRHDHWLVDTRDITSLKETEEKLRESLTELQQLKIQLEAENVFLREELDRGSLHAEIIGRNAALARVLNQVELVAGTNATVLISGETGTGKELVARAIHNRSTRRDKLFVAVNCAALPATLVESELFGHERGAFTGAVSRRLGRFEQADGGTLLLDEVGELPLETQAKMLRVLQSGDFERIGGGQTLKVNVRIIAASNRNLDEAVRDGMFRSDLYHRLTIFPIHMPPLRERRDDIPLLAAYLITRKAIELGRKIESIPATVLERLSAYDWPGNVRELENVLERAIILSPGTALRQEAILLGSAAAVGARERHIPADVTPAAVTFETLRAREQAYIVRVCQATDWKIKGTDGAATILGIDPGTLYARMKRFGIRRPIND